MSAVQHNRDHDTIFNIGVIGAGSWGTALANLLAHKGYNVELWAYEPEVVKSINERHENKVYLPGFTLPENLTASNSIASVAKNKDMILSASPSHVLRRVMSEARDHIPVGVPIVSASKGIENDSLMLVSEILEDVLPIRCHPYLAYLSGPSFAKEVASNTPTLVVIASFSKQLAKKIQHIFLSETSRTYTSHDVVGVECGGALKNVIAVASGVVTGLGFGHNATAAIVTRGLNEITRLAVRKGANPLTLAGLSGMGDLVLTCTGGLSRNRTVGLKLGQGLTLEEILADMTMVAEGIKTSRSVYNLSRKLDVEMPICDEVYRVLHEGKPVARAIETLMSRDVREEMRFYS